MSGDQLMTIGEAAAWARVSIRTATWWANSWRLPCTSRTSGGHRRFRRSDVEETARAWADRKRNPEAWLRRADLLRARVRGQQ